MKFKKLLRFLAVIAAAVIGTPLQAQEMPTIAKLHANRHQDH